MLILGDKEIENKEISVRNRKGQNSTSKLSEFVKVIKKEIEEKSN